jgi:hypothetical protein
VLSASDELGQVFDKYTAVVVQGRKLPAQHPKSGSASLLDLSTPSEEKLPPVAVELLSNQLTGLGTVVEASHTVMVLCIEAILGSHLCSENRSHDSYSCGQPEGRGFDTRYTGPWGLLSL